MRLVAAKLWNLRRKVLGNLVPMAVGLPFGAWGIWLAFERQQMIGPQLAIFALMPAMGWLTMNFLGLWGNASMKAELGRRLGAPASGPELSVWFVGLARPSYRGLLDPHEDVGFLILGESALQFQGESLNFKIQKSDLLGARFRPNVHSLVGLGRWVSIEGRLEGKPIRLLIEPRERPTLFGNLRGSKKLMAEISSWIHSNGPRKKIPEPV